MYTVITGAPGTMYLTRAGMMALPVDQCFHVLPGLHTITPQHGSQKVFVLTGNTTPQEGLATSANQEQGAQLSTAKEIFKVLLSLPPTKKG